MVVVMVMSRRSGIAHKEKERGENQPDKCQATAFNPKVCPTPVHIFTVNRTGRIGQR